MLQILWIGLIGLIYHFWPILCFLPWIFGFRSYIVKDTSKVNIIRKRLYSSSVTHDDKPFGFIFGMWYVGFITTTISSSNRGNEQIVIYLLSRNNSYQRLIHHTVADERNCIKLYSRRGAFYCIDYNCTEIDVSDLKPDKQQQTLINKIIDFYQKHKHVVVYVHGESGTGKSMTAILLTKILKGSICKTFNPTDPSNSLLDLITNVDPKVSSPLIVVLEEVDDILKKIHHNTIKPSNDYPIMIQNKSGWNTFLDEFDAGLYANTILFMTSNVSPTEINTMDNSYLRSGRVNIVYQMQNN